MDSDLTNGLLNLCESQWFKVGSMGNPQSTDHLLFSEELLAGKRVPNCITGSDRGGNNHSLLDGGLCGLSAGLSVAFQVRLVKGVVGFQAEVAYGVAGAADLRDLPRRNLAFTQQLCRPFQVLAFEHPLASTCRAALVHSRIGPLSHSAP